MAIKYGERQESKKKKRLQPIYKFKKRRHGRGKIKVRVGMLDTQEKKSPYHNGEQPNWHKGKLVHSDSDRHWDRHNRQHGNQVRHGGRLY